MHNMLFTVAAGQGGLVGFADAFSGVNFANLTGFALDTSGIFSLGLFHGLVFSLPFSAPVLICIYRFLVEGTIAGSLATAGTILGQICFLSFILGNFRSIIQFWYTAEPFLACAGFAITFKIAADFFSGPGQNKVRSIGNFNSFQFAAKSKIPPEMVSIFGLNFLLMFLNPAMPATSSRIVLASGALLPLTESFQLSSVYNFGFFITAAFCISVLWPIVFLGFIQFLNRGVAFTGTAATTVMGILGGTGSQTSPATQVSQSSYSFQPRFLTFLIVGCVISGALHYSWRLFTQYPVEAVLSQPGLSFSTREFPSFDSNIRHRDKNLPVDRHTPIEKMNARRTLSGRPSLSEEQKSDAYFKFNSFFVNGLEQNFENNLIASRTTGNSGTDLRRNYDEIDYLQKVKQQFNETSYLLDTQDTGTSLNVGPRNLENNTKGKPKFSYIRELVEPSMGRSATENPFLHDELQIYGVLLGGTAQKS